MALVKPIEINNSNVFLSYWRVGPIALDPDRDVTMVGLLGYLDEATRRAGKQPSFRKRLTMPRLTAEELNAAGNPYKAVYLRLKADAGFAGAQDV